MFTITLIGPDGTGKTTISKMLQSLLPVPTKYIYMGINPEASNYMLPTTRLWSEIKRARGKELGKGGPPDPKRVEFLPKNPIKRVGMELKSALRIANLIAEEWFRQFVAWNYQVRGYVVIFDRHFYFDYYKHHIADISAERPLGDRVHGFMLNHFYPKPAFVIFLDAPAEVLFSRKEEGTVELLEQRRQEYLQFKDSIENFVTVDAAQSMDEVVRQVLGHVMDFYLMKKSAIGSSSESRAK